jgi:hypothetical protein
MTRIIRIILTISMFAALNAEADAVDPRGTSHKTLFSYDGCAWCFNENKCPAKMEATYYGDIGVVYFKFNSVKMNSAYACDVGKGQPQAFVERMSDLGQYDQKLIEKLTELNKKSKNAGIDRMIEKIRKDGFGRWIMNADKDIPKLGSQKMVEAVRDVLTATLPKYDPQHPGGEGEVIAGTLDGGGGAR